MCYNSCVVLEPHRTNTEKLPSRQIQHAGRDQRTNNKRHTTQANKTGSAPTSSRCTCATTSSCRRAASIRCSPVRPRFAIWSSSPQNPHWPVVRGTTLTPIWKQSGELQSNELHYHELSTSMLNDSTSNQHAIKYNIIQLTTRAIKGTVTDTMRCQQYNANSRGDQQDNR